MTVLDSGVSYYTSFLAALARLLSHKLLFIRGEHHLKAPLYVRLGCSFCIGQFVLGLRNGYRQSLKETMAIGSAYLLALFASMVAYRLVFHPLRLFPGPFMYKVSKLWHVMKVAPSEQNYYILDDLHHRYGDFVRTGRETRMITYYK